MTTKMKELKWLCHHTEGYWSAMGGSSGVVEDMGDESKLG
jgi:hypothetical protein